MTLRLNELAPAEGAKREHRRLGRGIGSGVGRDWWSWYQRSKIT